MKEALISVINLTRKSDEVHQENQHFFYHHKWLLVGYNHWCTRSFIYTWLSLFYSEVIQEPMFWVVATASGLLGLAISFSSVWFLHQTGPTTYRWDYSTNLIVSTENIYIKERKMHSCDTSKVLITFVFLFSLVGSLNKIPISVAGILLFNVPVSVENFCSIVFGKYLFHLCCFSNVLLPCYPIDDTFLHAITRSFCWDILCKGKNVLKLFYPSVVVTGKVPAVAVPINCTEMWSEPILSRMPAPVMHRVKHMCVCMPSLSFVP